MTDKCECKDDKDKDLKEALKLSIENREFEIELFWKRAVVFWGVIAVLFVAVGYAGKNSDYTLSFLLSLAGATISFIWTLANRASKGWQESWEIKSEYFFNELYTDIRVKNIFGKANKMSNKEINEDKPCFKTWNDAHNRSLSRLLIVSSDFLVIFWVAIAIYFLLKTTCLMIIGFILVGGFCYYAWCATKSTADKWLVNYIDEALKSYLKNGIKDGKNLIDYLEGNFEKSDYSECLKKSENAECQRETDESQDDFIKRVRKILSNS